MITKTATKNRSESRSIESMIRPGDGAKPKRSKSRYAERLETLRRKQVRNTKSDFRSSTLWDE